MHTMWKGNISFGLVSIPIKLHAATENKDVKLRNLHKECKTPIQYEKTCPGCGKEVTNEDIVKAYEYAKNKFVVLDEEDLEELKKENEDKSVEIIDFVMLEEIDPIFFDRSYFMSPNDGGSKAYSLLRKALEDSGKIGLAKIIIRSKEHLAVIRVYQNTLVMETIHYPDEVRSVADVPSIPSEDNITDKELDTAKTLIEQLTTTFNPDKFQDEYRTALMELIEEKIASENTVTAEAKPDEPKSNVTDLMSALQASIDKTKKKKAPTKGKKKTTSATATKVRKNA
ncbi:non-homologous end joining protein Ku [Bacillus sp. FJAT-45350]|uniref:non-homologous end joining protein Ku n=1 Tax=Bacillus sp. FJAT-45350 TaxID=2011014 RepID=UPI000BB7D8BB|nr:Ku protein [Bacillus sp. FJAT-45350]